jgi:hypothetical protein
MNEPFLPWRRFELTPHQRHQLARLAIIGAVFVIVTLAPYRASQTQMLLGVAGIVALGGALFLLKHPPLGLVLAAVSGFFLPTFGPGRLNFTLLLVAGLTALWLLDLVANKKLRDIAWTPLTQSMAAFVAVSLIAFVVGQLNFHPLAGSAPLDAQVGGLALFVLSGAAFFMASTQLRSIGWLKALLYIYTGMSAVFLLFRNVGPLGGLARILFPERGAGGGVFWAWFPALTLSQALFNDDLSPRWRVLFGALGFGSLGIALFFNFEWKSVWVTALFTAGVILALRNWRIAVLGGVLGFVLVLLVAPDLIASEDYSLSTRLEAWLILAEIIKASPILGLGFANYYWITPLYPIRGWYVEFNSHNNYVDIVAQTGLVGLFCFLWFAAACANLAWRMGRDAQSGFEKAYAYGVLAGLAGTLLAAMLGDWLLGFVYNIGLSSFKSGVVVWLFLGGLQALHTMRQQQQAVLPR